MLRSIAYSLLWSIVISFSTTQCAYTVIQQDASLLSDIDAQHGLNDAISAIIIHVSHKFILHCNHIRH